MEQYESSALRGCQILDIVSMAVSIHPIQAPLAELAAAIDFGLVSVLLMIPSRNGIIAQARGVAPLCACAAFVWATLATAQTVLQPEKPQQLSL